MTNAISITCEVVLGLIGLGLFVKVIGWSMEYAALETVLLRPEKPTCEHGAFTRHPVFPAFYGPKDRKWLPSSWCDGP